MTKSWKKKKKTNAHRKAAIFKLERRDITTKTQNFFTKYAHWTVTVQNKDTFIFDKSIHGSYQFVSFLPWKVGLHTGNNVSTANATRLLITGNTGTCKVFRTVNFRPKRICAYTHSPLIGE